MVQHSKPWRVNSEYAHGFGRVVVLSVKGDSQGETRLTDTISPNSPDQESQHKKILSPFPSLPPLQWQLWLLRQHGLAGYLWDMLWDGHTAGLAFWPVRVSPHSVTLDCLSVISQELRSPCQAWGMASLACQAEQAVFCSTDVLLCGRDLFPTKQPSHGIFDHHL